MTALPPDIEIAQKAKEKLLPIGEVASRAGLEASEWRPYGQHAAKIGLDALDARADRPDGKLILVSGTSPTRAGNGKTVNTIGLSQALQVQGERAVVCLREPSLGPVFGIKGGAAGGGYSQVLPMEDINMHFTGDLHAITSAHNLLAAVVDNLVHFDNELGIDPEQITFPRVVDLCDRQLRFCEVGGGGKANGFPHATNFHITAASEIMAILGMAESDRRRSDGAVRTDHRGSASPTIGTADARPRARVRRGRNGGADASDALRAKPGANERAGTPAIVHGGPFANIAHGCNSVVATRLGAKLGTYAVTEAGFGADLGAEKFMHIKSRQLGRMPDATVLVLNISALKMHGGVGVDDLRTENLEAIEAGFANAAHHVTTLKKFGVPVVVAINRFPWDTDAEVGLVQKALDGLEVAHAVSLVAAKGGEGGAALAEQVQKAAETETTPTRLYALEDSLKEKIETVAREVYGADGVDYAPEAEASLERLGGLGFGELPVCMAKTQLSISDDAKKLGPREAGGCR